MTRPPSETLMGCEAQDGDAGWRPSEATQGAPGRAYLDRPCRRVSCRLALAATVAVAAEVLGSVGLSRTETRAANQPAKPDERPKGATAPAAPYTIEVTVRARDTGRPIEGATVRPTIDMQHLIRKTDRDGRVRIVLFRHKSRDTLNLDVWAEGYVQQRHFFSQNDARYPRIPDRVTIELWPGEQTLGGTVTDENGKPIRGVKVEIWGYLGAKKQKEELCWMVDATTDDQGRWRCRCFRDMQFAYLYLSHPDHLADGELYPRRHGRPRPTDQPQPNEKPMQALRDFSDVQAMARGAEVAGQVQDERGKPIQGAEVGWLEADHRDTFHHGMPTTTTDEQGRFRFPHARPGRLVLQVKAIGHAPELEPVQAKATTDPVTIRLGPSRTLTGRVQDSQGKPISGAFVVIDTWRGYRSLGVFLESDADGRFRWDDAPSDAVLINADHVGFNGVFRRSAKAGDEPILTLWRALSISGRVRDAATGQPIDQPQVEVGIPDPKTGAVRWGRNSRAFALQGHLQANIDVEDTPEFRLRIRAKGYEPFESRIFRAGEGQVEYDVGLKKSDKPEGIIVTGTVRRPDGRPLEGADVAITYPLTGGPDRLPSVHILGGRIVPDRSMTTTKTDASGRFNLTREPDPEGQHFAVIVVHPEYFAEAARPVFEADRTIAVRPWGRIEGVARIGSKPAAGAVVQYRSDRLEFVGVPRLSDTAQTKADGQGRFVLERVAPGDVRVWRVPGDGASNGVWPNGSLVEVKPGETARVEVGGRGRPVVARIATPPGFDPDVDYTAYSRFEIESDRPRIPYPKEFQARRDAPMIDWARRWWASAEGHEYRRHWFRFGPVRLRPDATIRVDDVPPGEYHLRITYRGDPINGPGESPDRVAHLETTFRVPEVPGGRSDEPLDLGVLRPKPK